MEAVTPARLFRDKVHLEGTCLVVEQVEVELANVRRLVIVGAGKAAAAMAVALQQVLLCHLPSRLPKLEVRGWINAPEGAFSAADVSTLKPIHLHTARPAGINQPTAAGLLGTQHILDLVGVCDQRDCVICLLSGGGSALLVAPAAGVTLADKQAVAQQIAAAGGNIEQLNAVRRPLSQVKGGGLARACGAGRLLTLILSDVLGDALETIASGPTVLTTSAENLPASAARALEVLDELGLSQRGSLSGVVQVLQQQLQAAGQSSAPRINSSCLIEHVILGNNADAVDAAGVKAVELGYRYVMQCAQRVEGDVHQLARSAAAAIEQLASQDQIDCWISGGEPTVTLPAQGAGRGGRNQQLALAVMQEMLLSQSALSPNRAIPAREVVFLSGGTDGEDGPTDAAGAIVDRSVIARAADLQLDASDYLARADAYSFFAQVGGLIRTGATGTNVCDIRIALCSKSKP